MSESAGFDATGDWDESLPLRDATGHAGVDAVLAALDDLDDLPAAEHIARYEQAHEVLRRVLDGLDDAPTLTEG